MTTRQEVRDVTDPGGDVTGNYMQVMRERGWSWDDLADDFDRQAQQPALDGGAAAERMARWARSNATAGRLREAGTPPDEPPRDAEPVPPKRNTVPRRPPERRG
jgi:hypothetical protein